MESATAEGTVKIEGGATDQERSVVPLIYFHAFHFGIDSGNGNNGTEYDRTRNFRQRISACKGEHYQILLST